MERQLLPPREDLSIADMVATIRGLASPNFGKHSFRDLLDVQSRGSATTQAWQRALSRREQEVLAQLRRGRSNKEIAAHLGVSITTVNKHVQQVLKVRRLHVITRRGHSGEGEVLRLVRHGDRQPERPEVFHLGRFHEAKEVREMYDAGHVGIDEFDSASRAKTVRHLSASE